MAKGKKKYDVEFWDKIAEFQNYVDECNNIVFFGGAGVSTESGIPDFRSCDGLYNQKYDYPPEEILSHTFFAEKTAEFYKFYRDKMIVPGVRPNKAHLALVRLEKAGKLKAIVTQNIDGLHQAAGSECVYELHGSILRNYCMKCGKEYGVDAIVSDSNSVCGENGVCNSRIDETGIPRCECGGKIKPDVVLYEERLNDATIEGAIRSISEADMLIIGGTSLKVYPAAGLIRHFRGKYIVMINREETLADGLGHLIFHESIGKVLDALE